MKIKLLFLTLCLTACSGNVDPAAFSFQTGAVQATQTVVSTVPATSTPTVTPQPTATIGYQETAIVAQQTANAAIELMVQATAEDERRKFEREAWTVTAEYMLYQNDQLTQAANAVTASAYSTAIPMTQTQQAIINMARATEQYMTLSAPTQIVAIAQSQTYAENASAILAVELWLKAFIGLFLLILSLYVAVQIVMVIIKPAAVKESIPNLDDVPLIIPFKTEIKAGSVLMRRAEIPCTVEQLIDFADGIVNRNMTTGFNMWEKTSVHKNLKDIREFMVEHHFAKVVRGSGGALNVMAEGESFLRECLQLGRPPTPFQCIG